MSRSRSISKSDWATATGNYIEEGDEELGQAIFPGYDLINHRPYGKKYRKEESLDKITSEYGSYSFFAEYDTPAGAEVLRTYDLLRNFQLLNFQGLVLRNNPDDFMYMDTSLAGFDSDLCEGGTYMEDVGRCRFLIFPDEINQNFMLFKRKQLTGDLDLDIIEDIELFDYYEMLPLGNETRYIVTFASIIYRNDIVNVLDVLGKVSYREQLRKQREVQDFGSWATYEYTIAEKLSLYRSLRLIDQQLFKMLFFDLALTV